MQMIDLVPDLAPIILAARELRDARNSLERFLPNAEVQAVSYRLGRRRRIAQTVPVRSIDAPAVPIRRPGILEVKGDLPAITPIVNLSEQDLTNEMVMARQLAGLQVDFTPAVVASAAEAAATVDNTLELMRGQVLSTGVISLETEDGTVHSVDFDVPGGQISSPPVAWDGATAAATVFTDLEAAHELYVDAAGDAAGVMLTSRRVASYLLNKLQALYVQQPIGQSALAAYLAERRLPPIFTYDRQLETYAGTKSRVFPDDVITFLPGEDAPVGNTQLGITQEAVQQVQGRILTPAQAAGVTIVTLGQDNPVQRAVKAAALGMPVLRDTDSIVIFDDIFG
jgi:hypothetical protein